MKKFIVFMFLLFIPCIVNAEYYHWIEQGVHNFSNCQKPPGVRGSFNILGSSAQTTPKTKAEKKETEISDVIKKIEDRNDKVKAIQEKYLQPGTDTLNTIIKLVN